MSVNITMKEKDIIHFTGKIPKESFFYVGIMLHTTKS
mgnify:CR=1 FL=1